MHSFSFLSEVICFFRNIFIRFAFVYKLIIYRSFYMLWHLSDVMRRARVDCPLIVWIKFPTTSLSKRTAHRKTHHKKYLRAHFVSQTFFLDDAARQNVHLFYEPRKHIELFVYNWTKNEILINVKTGHSLHSLSLMHHFVGENRELFFLLSIIFCVSNGKNYANFGTPLNCLFFSS